MSYRAFRGAATEDGKITLLTVDFRLTNQVVRLAQSFRRYVDPQGPVLVVQNGDRRDNRRLRGAGLKVHGWSLNIGHGVALDYGLSKVQTQYVLICDPDTIIIGDGFLAEMKGRLDVYGVCGIVPSEAAEHQRYHPVCLAFEVNLWKNSEWSMRENWDEGYGYDVGGALTRHLGGLQWAAVLPYTRRALHGDVWAEVFSSTYGMARIRNFADDEIVDGLPASSFRNYHQRWNAWADAIAEGSATANDFPQ